MADAGGEAVAPADVDVDGAQEQNPTHTELENLLRKATLQLLEDRSARADAVASVLPALEMILSGKEISAEDRTSMLQHIREWVAKQKEELGVGASTAVETREDLLCGWLRKKSGIRWERRWVVLDRSNLLYYKDVERSHLKGVIPLEGCVCRSVPRKSNEFTITNPDQDSGSINLLSREGKNKQTYVWQTRTPEEAARWIMALQKATQGKQSLRPTLDAQEKLRSAASTDEYARALAGVNEEEIEVPVSWVHHAVYDEMDAAEDTQTRSSLEVASAVANAERRMGTGSGYAPALTGRRPSGPGTQSGRWSSQETAARLASASERVRVTLLQLDRDMRRDTLCLNGTRIECATASHLLLRLARSLLDAYSDSQRVTKEGDGAAAASRSKRRRQSTVAAVARALQERREAKALEFAREVLLGCSRTRTGGDSFDAIDLVFGNHELVTVRPISTTEENPIDLRVGAWDDAEGEEELRRGPSGLKGGPHAHAAGRAVGGAGAGVKRLIGAQDEPLAASHTEWVPDNHSNRCMLCTGSFTFKNRRHHCRVCGILVCGNCSCSTLYDHRHEKRVRVCDSCFTARESGKDSGTLARSASSTSNRFTVDDDSTNTEWMWPTVTLTAVTQYELRSTDSEGDMPALLGTVTAVYTRHFELGQSPDLGKVALFPSTTTGESASEAGGSAASGLAEGGGDGPPASEEQGPSDAPSASEAAGTGDDTSA